MNRIDQLIAELCPDGVEYVAIEALFDLRNGYTPSTGKGEYWSNGSIPWFRMEDIRTNGRVLSMALQQITEAAVKGGRLFPENSLLVATSATIGEHALILVPHLSNQRFTSLSPKPDFKSRLDMKFAYYYAYVLDQWCVNNVTTSSFAAVDMVGFRKFRFPLPPLPIQHEIVKILDTFTELEARKKQYEYYRDELLKLADAPRMKVGDLFEFKNGLNKSKEYFGKGTPIVNFVDVFKNRTLATSTIKGRVEVTPKEKELYSARKNDVFFTRTSETREDIGMASVLLEEIDSCVFSGFVLRARPVTEHLLPKYCAYIFTSDAIRKEITRHSSFTTRALTNGTVLSRLSVPVPSKEEQERIVEILEALDALVNDLSSGLPAEIAARRKQYEHYRDRLLTFKEKVA